LESLSDEPAEWGDTCQKERNSDDSGATHYYMFNTSMDILTCSWTHVDYWFDIFREFEED
jgi:hypothetical protein